MYLVRKLSLQVVLQNSQQDVVSSFVACTKEEKHKTKLDSLGNTRSLKWSLSPWLLLVALGITAFLVGRFGCERIESSFNPRLMPK